MTEWLTIESAPKDGTHVVLFSPDAMEPGIFVGGWQDDDYLPDGGGWFDPYSEPTPIDADPSHWQPLPDPPTDPTPAALEYARKNPAGGPAHVFEVMAERIRAGEELDSVLDDYGYRKVRDEQR